MRKGTTEMSIRNVVKVMNFHALIRVDNAKRRADKYKMMEDRLMFMMDNILNNRNLILDKKILAVPENAPAINIYIGSDLGFCSNYNSQMVERLHHDDDSSRKIIIGRKLTGRLTEGADIQVTTAELPHEMPKIREYLERKILNKECSSINIFYNHYENTTTIYSKKLQVYPLKRREQENKAYHADFAIEGDATELLLKMTSSYVYYELLLAIVNSRAAENVMRQNATTESLKKIDEIEEEKVMEARREVRNKEFQKVVDNFVKQKMY